MKSRQLSWCATLLAISLSACVAAERPATHGDRQVAGWYTQTPGIDTFQACGTSEPLRITAGADLREQAGRSGMQAGDPIYVKLLVATSPTNATVQVKRVVQFGSPTPVRDCAITGVVHKASGQ